MVLKIIALSTALVLVALWCFVLVAWCFMCYTHSVCLNLKYSKYTTSMRGWRQKFRQPIFLLSHCNGLQVQMQKLCIFFCVLFSNPQANFLRTFRQINERRCLGKNCPKQNIPLKSAGSQTLAAPLGENCPNGSKMGKIELEGLSGKKGTILSNYLQ